MTNEITKAAPKAKAREQTTVSSSSTKTASPLVGLAAFGLLLTGAGLLVGSGQPEPEVSKPLPVPEKLTYWRITQGIQAYSITADWVSTKDPLPDAYCIVTKPQEDNPNIAEMGTLLKLSVRIDSLDEIRAAVRKHIAHYKGINHIMRDSTVNDFMVESFAQEIYKLLNPT